MMNFYINNVAHIKTDSNGVCENPHTLLEHLEGVADLAEKFAADFGMGKFGRAEGLGHDVLKASERKDGVFTDFQMKIRMSAKWDDAPYKGMTLPKAPHSDGGSQYVVKIYGAVGRILAYCIAGHHGGLPNGKDATDYCLDARLVREVANYVKALENDNIRLEFPDNLTLKNLPFKKPMDGFTLSFAIRMLFSCLVDADYLDTERYMQPEKFSLRENHGDLETMSEILGVFLTKKFPEPKTDMEKIRALVLEECQAAYDLEPGFFSLTAPTGGGKTYSSLAFALSHAVKHGKKRIIYGLPYTTVIEQISNDFRAVFDEDFIVEHHYQVDFKDQAMKLATENWDRPLVVTTNVQFFESLFANRPARCRKLHNIANSVIILDEAQMIPPDLLRPSVRALQELVVNYGCSVVFCTATQPALEPFTGVTPREIIQDPEKLQNQTRRVKIKTPYQAFTHEEIASSMTYNRQNLCVVNTRRDAYIIYKHLVQKKMGGLFFLTTDLCAVHRSQIVDKIKNRIKAGKTCRVISTQLVEAGMNLSFPKGFRVMAGLDSIGQIAGRVNRNGEYPEGTLYVFSLKTRTPEGLLKQTAEDGRKTLIAFKDDPLCLEALHSYFECFYWKRKRLNNLDAKNILERLEEDTPNLNFPFRDVSQDFRFIQTYKASLVVPWGVEGQRLCTVLSSLDFDRNTVRQAQRFMVQLRKSEIEKLETIEVSENLFVLTDETRYDKHTGMRGKNNEK